MRLVSITTEPGTILVRHQPKTLYICMAGATSIWTVQFLLKVHGLHILLDSCTQARSYSPLSRELEVVSEQNFVGITTAMAVTKHHPATWSSALTKDAVLLFRTYSAPESVDVEDLVLWQALLSCCEYERSYLYLTACDLESYAIKLH